LARRAKGASAVADRIGDEAARRFQEANPGLRLAPVVAVIPAYNEEEALGGVLDEMPAEACGLAVETVVVDDGSSDRTSEVARQHGAHIARLAQNCGQGAAFRAGYKIAREQGARIIVTLDADGQWDPADIPAVLEPVVADEADFALGSRALGRSEGDDAFRQAGVHVFATLVSRLGGTKVTDTSSGLRAMKAEVTAAIRQEQPQYQSAELLLGAIFAGYRIAERPIVMRKRAAGVSKKGHNVLYGLRYAGVVLRTWWRDRGARERIPPTTGAPEPERAPEIERTRG
jgi:glycosyltransferase involved in cell wall biosynthesis